MKHFSFLIFILLISTLLNAKELQKVSLQLLCSDQLQLSGYYMAKEKGFYKDLGLAVEFKKFDVNISIVDEVISGKSTYGIGDSTLVIDKSNGKDIVLLSSIFQSSSSVILATKDSNITKTYPNKNHFDIYNDILFTSKSEFIKHKQRTIDFKMASIKGWKYAFAHTDETLDLILKKYNYQDKSRDTLRNEAKKLVYNDNAKLGEIEKNKIKKIYDLYHAMGYVKNKVQLQDFIVFNQNNRFNFTDDELTYMNNKDEIIACACNNCLPYSGTYNGQAIGIGVDFFNLIMKNISIKHSFKIANSLTEMQDMLKSKECDIKIVTPTEQANPIYKVSDPYLSDSLVLITRIEEPFIDNLKKLQTKKILVTPNFRKFKNYIHQNYKNIDIKEVNNIEIALDLVESKKVYAYIGTLFNTSNLIQKKYSAKLKIMNDLESINYGIAVNNGEKHLLGILNKSINSITYQDNQKILNKWVSTVIEKPINYNFIWQLSGLFIFILSIVLYFYNKLRRLKNSLDERVKERTKNLEDSLKNFQDLLDATTEAIVLSDTNQNIVSANNASVKLIGGNSKNDIIGKNLLDMLPDSEKAIANGYIQTNSTKPYELIIRQLNGKLLPTLAAGTNIIRDGEKLRISTLLDISELKEKNKQLLQQTKLAQMGEMIGMIAHQWRQPLNTISAASANLSILSSMERLDEPKTQEISTSIQTQCQKMSATIDTFMNFVRPSEEPHMFKLSSCVDSIMQIMGIQLRNKNIKININIEDRNISTLGQDDLLEQVIINLLANSRDAFDEQDDITQDKFININIFSKGSIPIISIIDNAGGIPKEISTKIFNPYFTTKQHANGTGLGLYMSIDIMRKSFNGNLVYKELDGGSCFEIICNKNIL